MKTLSKSAILVLLIAVLGACSRNAATDDYTIPLISGFQVSETLALSDEGITEDQIELLSSLKSTFEERYGIELPKQTRMTIFMSAGESSGFWIGVTPAMSKERAERFKEYLKKLGKEKIGSITIYATEYGNGLSIMGTVESIFMSEYKNKLYAFVFRGFEEDYRDFLIMLEKMKLADKGPKTEWSDGGEVEEEAAR